MILITGAAGFIGSAFLWHLNQCGISDIIISDKLKTEEKWKNIAKSDYYDWVDRDELFDWLKENGNKIKHIIHMGACSATTEKDADFLMKNNYEYTKKLWEFSCEKQINFIYASSAATYGDGELGYDDEIDLEGHKNLRPLNKYGYSKKIFDVWALKQEKTPKQWVGLKFFNVYGPNEYHKGTMSSVVYHSFNQLKNTGKIKLFKSYKEGFEDGKQLRDFVYIKDIVKVMKFFIDNEGKSGIYNLGTGKADSFLNLAESTWYSYNSLREEKEQLDYPIDFVEMPEHLKGRYQYFTEAKMDKLRKVGYTDKFFTLEEGVKDYVINHLSKEDQYL